MKVLFEVLYIYIYIYPLRSPVLTSVNCGQEDRIGCPIWFSGSGICLLFVGQNSGCDSGLKVCREYRMLKMTIQIMGLSENLVQDKGMKNPIGDPL